MESKKLIYQVLPRLWGEGKFSSMDEASLAYIKSLGMDYIWYTGILRHSTGKPYIKGNIGSPYSIIDYYDTNPYLADNERSRMQELKSLIERTHAYSLKCIIDFVPNHVSPDYSDKHGGIPVHNYCDFDWTDTVKIDYGQGHSQTWDKLLDILLFWAGKGIDGFRCDMVEMVPAEFFTWAISEVKARFPSVIFIAEVYSKDNYWKYVKEVGFDLLYDKSGRYDNLRSIMCYGDTARKLTWGWQELGDLQPCMLDFLENHDEQRVASKFFLGSAHMSLAALAVSMLFNTSSFMLYFGQELGEDAGDSPNGRTSIFDIEEVPSAMTLYNRIHHGNKGMNFQEGIYARIKELLDRAASSLYRKGLVYDLCYCNNSGNGFNPDRHFAFARSLEGKAELTVANFSKETCLMDIIIPAEALDYLGLESNPEGKRINVKVESMDASFVMIL